MKKKISFLIIASFLVVLKVFGVSPITLEHTFDGYYYPYNFQQYLASDDDRYFYSPIINPKGGRITLKTYNEDYSLRDNFDVSYSVPNGYEGATISFSSSYQLTDGTPFFIVTFNSQSIGIGNNGFSIANMYNARTGKLIAELGSASSSVSSIGTIYIINGKPSIVMIYIDYSRDSAQSTYTTKVFSLGTPDSSVHDIHSDNRNVAPVYIYDMNGRLLNMPTDGMPYIGIMPDGTSKVMIK